MAKREYFGSIRKTNDGLKRAAEVAVRQVLAVKRGETALIVTNPVRDVLEISQAVYDAILSAGGSPSLMVQPVKTPLDFAEDSVSRALQADPDIAISLSHNKLGKDRFLLKKPVKFNKKSYDSYFTYLMAAKKMRSFWSPSVTKRMFVDTVPVDYPKLRATCKRLKGLLDKASGVHITAPSGTDIFIGTKGRKTFVDDGDFRRPGRGGNLPAGEVFVSPALGGSEGTIAFDGSITLEHGEIVIKEPIVCDVKGGFVRTVKGGKEAKLLRAALENGERTAFKFAEAGKIPKKDGPIYAKNAWNLGELGIGLNEKARIVGNMLEDEKVYRTCHIAIGANYDEDANALIHLDGLIRNPTMAAMVGGREKQFMEDGKLL